MANKSLTDLTARTATADSDLLHINSGGTDYKQTKSDFAKSLVEYHEFNNTSTLLSQVDALASVKSPAFYAGKINSYNHMAVTGMPIDNSFHVRVSIYSGQYIEVRIIDVDYAQEFYKIKKAGTWDSSWTMAPARYEITSLNNSLTTLSNKFVTRGYSVTTGNSQYSSFYYGDKAVDTSLGTIVGVVITSTTSNQAAFASIVSSNTVRVFSPISGLTAGVQVLFMAT